MKKILVLSASYLPVLGGLQTAASRVAVKLRERGHEIVVVTCRYPRQLPVRETMEGVPVRRYDFLKPGCTYLAQGRPDLFVAGLIKGPVTFLRLLGLVWCFRPDVLHMHFPDSQIPYIKLLRFFTKARLVVSLHGDDVERFDEAKGTSRNQRVRFGKFLLKADAVTACSQYLLDQAEKIAPGLASKAHVIHNGVDLEIFSPGRTAECKENYIFAFGRFVPKKGFDLLIEAWALLAGRYPGITLKIGGEGPQQSELQQQASRQHVAESVNFVGRRTPLEIAAFIRGSLFVVIPSREEPFGIAALEAMAIGKPVLATRVGGMAEFLDSGATLLVKPDADSLAEGIDAWLGQQGPLPVPDLSQRSVWSWDRVARQYENVVEGRE